MNAYPPYTVARTLPSEAERVALLKRLALLDTPPEETFDRVTRLATTVLKVPIALLSLVDDRRQWFKSKVGLSASETARDIAFCPHAMLGDDLMVVPDAQEDPRFRNNPLVTDSPSIRFYAGMPLRSSNGLAFGTLCVIDTHARQLSEDEAAALRDLAAIVRRELLQRETAALSNSLHKADSRALAESKAIFQAAFQQAAVGFAVLATDGRYLQINPRFATMLGYAEADLIGRHFTDLLVPEERALARLDSGRLLHNQTDSYTAERRYVRGNGEIIWINAAVSLARTADGTALHFVLVAEEITSRREAADALAELRVDLETRVVRRTAELEAVNRRLAAAIDERDRTIEDRSQVEAALLSSRETLRTITDNLPVLIGDIDSDLRYQFNNAAYGKILNVDPTQLKGQRVADVVSPALMAELMPYFERALAGERVTNDNLVYQADVSREDEIRIWNATYIPHWQNDRVSGFYVVSYDVTESKRLASSLTELALQDALTSLPNRRALLMHLTDAMALAAPASALGVLFLDLDGFKPVNDTFGHETGDVLLKRVAERLRASVRAVDVVARLAGDEFVIVLHGLRDVPAEATRIASHIVDVFASPFDVDGRAIQVGTSIGIATYSGSDDVALDADGSTGSGAPSALTAMGLLARADRAMYAAKRNGANRFSLADANDPAIVVGHPDPAKPRRDR